MKIFRPNITSGGRALRALAGIATAVAAALVFAHSQGASLALALLAAFLLFEAARGWCAARACGIKTPL